MSIFKKFDRANHAMLVKRMNEKTVNQAVSQFNPQALILFLSKVDTLYQKYWAQGKTPPILLINNMWEELMKRYDYAKTVKGDGVLELQQLDGMDEENIGSSFDEMDEMDEMDAKE